MPCGFVVVGLRRLLIGFRPSHPPPFQWPSVASVERKPGETLSPVSESAPSSGPTCHLANSIWPTPFGELHFAVQCAWCFQGHSSSCLVAAVDRTMHFVSFSFQERFPRRSGIADSPRSPFAIFMYRVRGFESDVFGCRHERWTESTAVQGRQDAPRAREHGHRHPLT